MLFLSFSHSLVASWVVLGLLSPAVAAIAEAAADDVEVAVVTNTVTVTILSTSTLYPSSCPLEASLLLLSNVLRDSSIAIPTNEILSSNLTLMPHAPTASILLPSLFQSNLTNTMATVTASNVSTSPTMMSASSSYLFNTTSAIASQSVQQNSTTLASAFSMIDDVEPTTSSEQPSSSPISTISVPASTSAALLDTSMDPSSFSTSIQTATALTTSLDIDISSMSSSSTSGPPMANSTTAPVASLDLPTIVTSSVEATTTSSEFPSTLDDTTTASTTPLDVPTSATDSVEATPTSTASSSILDDTTTVSTTPLDMTTSTMSSVEPASSSTLTDVTTTSVTSIDTTPSSTSSTTSIADPTDTNLVVNGGFETSSISYSPWILGVDYPYVTYSVNDTVAAHGGSIALQLQYSIVTGLQTYITQTLSTSTGSAYDFSMWVMPETSVFVGYCIIWAHNAVDRIIASMQFTAATTSSWRELTGTYTATSDSTVLYLRTECMNAAIRTRTIFVDDVSMTLAS
ncbi:hypothetical protein BDV97DRAFT_194776 [Delphinella strobiligena]|nr:hypothetical protein BDV97DRAFT_194776 [Delphinella strobiligena]